MTHRHAPARGPWITLGDAVRSMEEHGANWATQGPFAYCPICKCVPVTYCGEDREEEEEEEENSNG